MQRLRFGEVLAGLSALALFGVSFLDFFGGEDAWSSLGWAALAACVFAMLAGIALPIVTATHESPVLPVLTAIVTTTAAGLAIIALLVQVVLQPGNDEVVMVRSGWWLGLIASFGVAVGGRRAMRDEYTPHARERPVDARPAPPVA